MIFKLFYLKYVFKALIIKIIIIIILNIDFFYKKLVLLHVLSVKRKIYAKSFYKANI